MHGGDSSEVDMFEDIVDDENNNNNIISANVKDETTSQSYSDSSITVDKYEDQVLLGI